MRASRAATTTPAAGPERSFRSKTTWLILNSRAAGAGLVSEAHRPRRLRLHLRARVLRFCLQFAIRCGFDTHCSLHEARARIAVVPGQNRCTHTTPHPSMQLSAAFTSPSCRTLGNSPLAADLCSLRLVAAQKYCPPNRVNLSSSLLRFRKNSQPKRVRLALTQDVVATSLPAGTCATS